MTGMWKLRQERLDMTPGTGKILCCQDLMPAEVAEVAELRASAEQGDAAAQFTLMFISDREDDAEAVRWYRLAADQGIASAQNNLGFMYARGRGVPQDDVQAHMWYNLSASHEPGGPGGTYRRAYATSLHVS